MNKLTKIFLSIFILSTVISIIGWYGLHKVSLFEITTIIGIGGIISSLTLLISECFYKDDYR